MTTKNMITAIDAEIARLQLARELLMGEPAATTGGAVKKGAKKKATEKAARVPRVLSPEARERIAAAQRKRWAAAKKAARKAAK